MTRRYNDDDDNIVYIISSYNFPINLQKYAQMLTFTPIRKNHHMTSRNECRSSFAVSRCYNFTVLSHICIKCTATAVAAIADGSRFCCQYFVQIVVWKL